MKAASHVRAAVTDDAVVVLDLRTGEIFSANSIAARVWRGLILEERSKDEIVEAIAADCSIPRDTVSTDVDAFIEGLRAQALVVDA